MSPEQTLAFEARSRRRQMTVAVAAALLLIAAAVLGRVGPHAAVSEVTVELINYNQRAGLVIIAAVVTGIGEIGAAITLLYLYRCATARSGKPMSYIPVLIGLGALAAVIGGVADAVFIVQKAGDFATTGAQTYDEAENLTKSALVSILPIILELGLLLTAISYVLVSLLTIRVGLLPKFLGYVGIFAGIVVLFANSIAPILLLYWLLSVAILVSGNWPSGLPPAWSSGRAEPWPSSAEVRARRMADAQQTREQRAASKRGGRRARVKDEAPAAQATLDPPAREHAGDEAAHSGAPSRSSTPKRKRKRRH